MSKTLLIKLEDSEYQKALQKKLDISQRRGQDLSWHDFIIILIEEDKRN